MWQCTSDSPDPVSNSMLLWLNRGGKRGSGARMVSHLNGCYGWASPGIGGGAHDSGLRSWLWVLHYRSYIRNVFLLLRMLMIKILVANLTKINNEVRYTNQRYKSAKTVLFAY